MSKRDGGQRGTETRDASTPGVNWQEKFITALIAAVLGGLVSSAASYYTHGREIATLETEVASIKEQLSALQARNPQPVASSSPAAGDTLPAPAVEITSYTPGQAVDVQRPEDGRNMARFFSVGGTSSNVDSNSKFDLYILVHPAAEDYWYVQDKQPSFEPSGSWHTVAWIGNEKESPKEGDRFDVAAVVTEPSRVAALTDRRVRGVKELAPKAHSVVNGLVVKLPK